MGSRTTSKDKKGFTLVEVLVVLIIVGSVFAVGAMANVNLLTRATANSEEATLVNTLARARSRSMNNVYASKHAVHIENGADYYVIYRQFPYNASEPTNEKVWREKAITIDDGGIISGGTGDVVFEQLSGNVITPGIITLTDTAGRTQTITIASNGLINW